MSFNRLAIRPCLGFAPVRMPVMAALGLLSLGITVGGAHAGESYVSVGVPGVVVGYAHSVNQKLGLRADAGTMGSVNRTHTVSGVGFDTKILRKIVAIRKQDANERMEQEAILELYMTALGMVAAPPEE